MQTVALMLIRAYQLVLSPFIGWHCRFEPTCSAYAREAIITHGVGKGCLLTFRRLLRCRPGGALGLDPVPPCCDKTLPMRKKKHATS